MRIFKRMLYQNLWQEQSSEKRMILLSGPRQVGKTTFARDIIGKKYKNKIYFNWDIINSKKILIEDPFFFEKINRADNSMPLVIFDEIHKYKNWKNYLKGTYDKYADEWQFLITGSGRLDLYQKGGDSLAGRYLEFHLFPFTIAELSVHNRKFKKFIENPLVDFNLNSVMSTRKSWNSLFELSGFPEPFIKGKKTFWTKWSQTYTKQIIREDLRSITDFKNIDSLELLFSLIPSRIGSPFSINSIAGDLQVAFETVKNWLRLFEIYYLVFNISPWTNNISRAILKEKKYYLFNYPLIQDKSVRFENMIALELMRAMYCWNEYGYGSFSLHYIRNKEKNEVDFVIADNNKPILLIEAKLNDIALSKNLLYFQSILKIPAIQLVDTEDIHKYIDNEGNKILITTAHRWLSSLP